MHDVIVVPRHRVACCALFLLACSSATQQCPCWHPLRHTGGSQLLYYHVSCAECMPPDASTRLKRAPSVPSKALAFNELCHPLPGTSPDLSHELPWNRILPFEGLLPSMCLATLLPGHLPDHTHRHIVHGRPRVIGMRGTWSLRTSPPVDGRNRSPNWHRYGSPLAIGSIFRLATCTGTEVQGTQYVIVAS